MYDSDERRDSDILDLAEREPSEIRERLLGGTTVLARRVRRGARGRLGGPRRTDAGRSLDARVASLPSMRLREVEIHHVDLGADYTTADWSRAVLRLLLDAMAKRLRPDDPFEVKPLDSDAHLGGRADRVRVPRARRHRPRRRPRLVADRPARPETLSCSRGELPEIGAW